MALSSKLLRVSYFSRAIFSSATLPRRAYCMGSTEAPFLLTPQDLKEASLSTGSKVVTLDASWHMPNSPRRSRDEFAQRRLSNARFLDLDEVASPHELGLKHMMPSAKDFTKACGKCNDLL